MEECFKCGISGESVKLYDAIGREGVIRICNHCSSREHIPVIRQPEEFQLKEADSRSSVYDRLSSMAGLDAKEHHQKISGEMVEKLERLKRQDSTLKGIVDKNVKLSSFGNLKQREDLVNNFHWIVMRARRSKKLTQAEFARAIGEPEAVIRLMEKGNLPVENSNLINKVEVYLGVRLVKEKKYQGLSPIKHNFEKDMQFDKVTSNALTISDLRQMKKLPEDVIHPKKSREIVLNQNVDISLGKREDQPEFVFKEENLEIEEKGDRPGEVNLKEEEEGREKRG